jgi:hypothetical protein
MKISEMEPAAAGAELYRQYMSAHDAWVANRDCRHPSFDTKAWRQTARDAGTLREAATDEGGLGPVEIQKRGASDDVEPEKTAGGNNGNGSGPMPAQDGRYTVTSDSRPVFETADGRVLHGNDALLARAEQSNPSRASNMAARIKGFDRLK